jgi:SAM-dependent methyltransferase
MTDWTGGYTADIGYTFGYYNELNPLWHQLAFLNAGLVPPPILNACELGFGQGLSVNIHAAASDCQWYGTDFNPAQAGFAQELSEVSGAGARLFDQSFAEFSGHADLPAFDYIGVHGIWSWISDENRAAIVDFVRRKLAVGGVLYISYNTQPGWASMVPMRDLLIEHGDLMGVTAKGIVSRIEGALDFAENLLATTPLFARAYPHVADRIKAMKLQNRNYLAHEYFNRDWLPMSFARMAEWLAPAKLNFACSANYLDFVDAVNLTARQQTFLKDIPDFMFRETVRDFMVNQQFRKEYWVKGARRLSLLDQAEAMRRQRVMLMPARADVSLKFKGALGEATMQEQTFGPILDALSDHAPRSLGEIERAVKDKAVSFGQIREATLLLRGAGTIVAVQDEGRIGSARKRTEKLNAFLCNKARGGQEINFLASPVTGGGVTVGRFPQLFLLARSQGKKQPLEWAQFAWQIMGLQGQKIVKEGKTLEAPEQNLAELNALAQGFADKQLHTLKALGIAQ